MTFEEAFGTWLMAGAIGTATSDRVWPLVIPQSLRQEQRLPCVVYTLVGRTREGRFCSTDALRQSQYQLDCLASTYLGAKQLAAVVEAALLDYRGPMGAFHVNHAFLRAELDLTEPDPGIYRVSQTWELWHGLPEASSPP